MNNVRANHDSYTVSIGIPAFNEAATIPVLIKRILKQKQQHFNLKEILINNDGSTDNTVELVKKIKNDKITLLGDKRRLGKATRLNEIMKKKAQSDILILLDADIILSTPLFIEKLIKPFFDNHKVMLTSAHAAPLKPETFVQRVIMEEYYLRREMKNIVKNSDMYSCDGTNRALRRKVYKVMKFQSSIADDVFPYLYIRSHNYLFQTIKNTMVYYQLPRSFADYRMQMRRYLKSEDTQSQFFSEELIRTSYTFTPAVKLKALFKRIVMSPFYSLLYICFLIYPKVAHIFEKEDTLEAWDAVHSTKQTVKQEHYEDRFFDI